MMMFRTIIVSFSGWARNICRVRTAAEVAARHEQNVWKQPTEAVRPQRPVRILKVCIHIASKAHSVFQIFQVCSGTGSGRHRITESTGS